MSYCEHCGHDSDEIRALRKMCAQFERNANHWREMCDGKLIERQANLERINERLRKDVARLCKENYALATDDSLAQARACIERDVLQVTARNQRREILKLRHRVATLQAQLALLRGDL